MDNLNHVPHLRTPSQHNLDHQLKSLSIAIKLKILILVLIGQLHRFHKLGDVTRSTPTTNNILVLVNGQDISPPTLLDNYMETTKTSTLLLQWHKIIHTLQEKIMVTDYYIYGWVRMDISSQPIPLIINWLWVVRSLILTPQLVKLKEFGCISTFASVV